MHPSTIKNAFDRGENITSLLRSSSRSQINTVEIIETAYDLQAGSYISALQDPAMISHKMEYGKAIALELCALTNPGSIIEVGVGEGTTFSFVLDYLERPDHVHGFDISWSRIVCCRGWLRERGHGNAYLSIANLTHIPYADSSFDVVYTSHTIEPNGGNEETILKELYRITSRFLVLLEPGYELASENARARMDKLGYCKNLVKHAEKLGMRVVKHELFPFTANPMNPTAITVIEKNANAATSIPQLACPRYGDHINDRGDSLYGPECLRAYPKIKGIPCLRRDDGVVASSYDHYGNE